MKLEPREIIKTCSKHYNTWKEEALKADSKEKAKKYLEKAFFWLELQSNLLILWTIKASFGNDPEVKRKIELAQANINKKIAEYTSQLLKDLSQL